MQNAVAILGNAQKLPLFPLCTVKRVFDEVKELFDYFSGHQGISVSLASPHYARQPSSCLQKYFKHRNNGRRHIEIPLVHVLSSQPSNTLANFEKMPWYLSEESVRTHLSSGILCAFDRLFQAALSQLTKCLDVDALAESLCRTSVLRLLCYPKHVGTPPHYDPGLCTILLPASKGGLQVAVPTLPCTGVHPLHSAPLSGMSTVFTSLPPPVYQWADVASLGGSSDMTDSDCLLMCNDQLQRISEQRLKAVWHRVNPDWGCDGDASSTHRYNVVVEIRLPASVLSHVTVRSRCSWSNGVHTL